MSRILIVDDEPALAMALDDDLRREGYDVEVAGDGDTAVRQGAAARFDLILLDVMLPGRDGFEVCRELRRAGVLTPILILTARTHEAERVMGLELGADDYVTKPYSARELRARVKALLRRGRTSTNDIVVFGDAEMDLSGCMLRRAGKVVDLTPLEYKLLATFVRRPGRVLSRQQLLDEVWGSGTFVTERVVDNQVTNLRKKIEPDPEHPRHIVNLRGLGYRFDPL